MKAKILIVEDQFIEANNLRNTLERAEYSVCSIARSVSEALEIIQKESPNLVLLDIQLQGELTGIDLAYELNEMNIAFVYISANSNKNTLDAAKVTRPYGFLVKPFRDKDVLVMLDIAWYQYEQRMTAAKRSAIRKQSPVQPKNDKIKGFIGNSDVINEVIENISIVSKSDSTVLILGESGTGKEVVANVIHKNSQRREKPFIVVNCAALPATLIESELFGHEKSSFTGALTKRTGKFELANGGTIFLDEIGELSVDLQVKFLRVLQEKEIESIGGVPKKINIRVIAATNRDLEGEVAAGRFRLDLYYRLNVFPITLPALRDRNDDILLLADYFLDIYSKKENKVVTGFSKDAIKELRTYFWPGNVRELENVIERNVLLAKGSVIEQINMPKNHKKTDGTDFRTKTMEENEKEHILNTLLKCNWKIAGDGGAAEILDINASTLKSRIKKLGIIKF